MLRCWEAVPGDRPSTGDLVTTLESLLGEEGGAEYRAMFREYMDHKPLILREGNSAEREKCGDKTPAEASSGYIQMSEAVGESNHYIEEVKCVIPDRSYNGVYDASVKNCQEEGQFDFTSTGHVSNVCLMAQKSGEYGSHDKTLEIGAEGTVIVTNANDTGDKIFEHDVEAGNIRDSVVKPHTDHSYSKVAMELVNKYLADHGSTGCDIEESVVTPHSDHTYSSPEPRSCLIECQRLQGDKDKVLKELQAKEEELKKANNLIKTLRSKLEEAGLQ